MLNVDSVLLQLGRLGRYQLMVAAVCSFSDSTLLALNFMSLTFQTLDVTKNCNDTTRNVNNSTSSEQYRHDMFCESRQQNRTNETLPAGCLLENNWRFEDDPGNEGEMAFWSKRESIVSEWDLTCDRGWLASFSYSIFMLGVGCGSLLISHLADRWGRKPILLASLWSYLAIALLCSISPNFAVFLVAKFLLGALGPGYALGGAVLKTEWMAISARAYAHMLGSLGWSLGVLFLALMAYLVRGWRLLQVVITLPALATLGHYWILPESPHWLASRGKSDQALKLLRKAAKFNNVTHLTIDDDDQSGLELRDHVTSDGGKIQKGSRQRGGSLADFFRNRPLLFRSSVMSFLWFVNSLVYYGLSMYTPAMSGDLYTNYALFAMVEVPSSIITIIILQRFGRKRPLAVFHVIAGLPLLALTFLPKDSPTDVSEDLSLALSLVGKYGISSSFITVYIYAAELYPTVVRNIGLGYNSCWARAGGILAPFVILVAKSAPAAPPLTFGALSLTCAALVLILPETSREPLPETFGDLATEKKRKGGRISAVRV